jgi:hypothetical protein
VAELRGRTAVDAEGSELGEIEESSFESRSGTG